MIFFKNLDISPPWLHEDTPYLLALERLHYYLLKFETEMITKYGADIEMAKQVLTSENYDISVEGCQQLFTHIGYPVKSENSSSSSSSTLYDFFPSLVQQTFGFTDAEIQMADQIAKQAPAIKEREASSASARTNLTHLTVVAIDSKSTLIPEDAISAESVRNKQQNANYQTFFRVFFKRIFFLSN